MAVLILSNLIGYAVAMGLFVWSLFYPIVASYVFVGLAALFVAYLFVIDICTRPEPDTLVWTPEEIQVIRKYHLALRFPFAARGYSCYLNGIRWSSLVWVPWMLWNRLWIPAAFLAINFFLTASLCFRLDPFFFLCDAVSRGRGRFAGELAKLRAVKEKANERARPRQGDSPNAG